MKLRTLVIATILLVVIAFMCLEQGALWGSIIAGFISVILLIYAITKGVIYTVQIKRLAKIYHQPQEDLVQYCIATKVSSQPREIKITIELLAKVRVRFMYISCENGEAKPTITKVYELNEGENYQNSNIDIRQKENGAWNWTYRDPLLKRKGEHIRIGIKCVAENAYNGKIKVYLACAEGKKDLCIPFRILPNSDKVVSPT